MEIGMFEKEYGDPKIKNIAELILPDILIDKIYRVCERYGENEDEIREYDAYKIVSSSGNMFLKKACELEAVNYEKYLSQGEFKVPEFFGKTEENGETWILIGAIDGSDLRDMTDEKAIAAAHSIADIQNRFWNNTDTERFDTYLVRIERRNAFIKDEGEIGEAYRIFLERQKTCPRTMSNGDLLEFNAVSHDGQVYIIDWGFGGIMPYSLDLARFIAHATEDRATFPFYMKDEQKLLFLREVYACLNEKPDFEQFIYDVKLAVLNEYVEFIEADEDDDKWYYNHAKKLAKEILRA